VSDECEFDDTQILNAIEEVKGMLSHIDHAIRQLQEDVEYIKRRVKN
jgi:hypothetical protein